MVLFTAREMSGGHGHEHVVRLWWRDTGDGKSGEMDIDTASRWLDKGNRAFVEDQARPGAFIEAGVVKPAHGHWYIRTHADGRWTDNLLALPLRQAA